MSANNKPPTSDQFYETLSSAMREATKEAARLRDEVALLRLDRERLDYLIASGASIHCRHGDPTDQEPIWTVDPRGDKAVTKMASLREVIDNARGIVWPQLSRYNIEWREKHREQERERKRSRKNARETS